MKQSFEFCEQYFLNAARLGYSLGFGRFGRVGSCALVCVVANNKVYTGNAGDSVGILVQQTKSGQMNYTELNRQLNANNSEERQRLKKLFPSQSDIVVCKRQDMKACYVKGRLQPTRSIGDLRLKYPQFNNPQNFSSSHDYQSPLKTFTGPYITSQPQISIIQLKKTDKCIVLASDGLWDQLGRQQVAQMFKDKKCEEVGKNLLRAALQNAAKNAKMPLEQLMNIPAGKKRDLHDDITIVVIDLESQYK